MAAPQAACWRQAARIAVIVSACLGQAACARAPHPPQPFTYYLSPSGNDAAAGTSPATAWRSLGRASRAVLRPGTRLLLKGGGQFTGQLTVGPQDAGVPAWPLLISSYGRGTATITSSSAAVYIYDTGGVDVANLRLTGTVPAGKPAAGVNLYNDLPAGHRLDHVVLTGISASGFADGIVFGGEHDESGFGDVQVSNCVLDGNVDAGLASYGPAFNARSPSYANEQVTVSHVVAAGNYGNPSSQVTNTGNGIVLGSVRDGTITWSTADGNGRDSSASHGPIGIWAYDSTRVVIERSLSFGNRTRNRIDGNGFGLDQNVSDSVLQEDLSYGNDGAGFLVYSGQRNTAQRDNVVRDNISSGDTQDGNAFYGGIAVIGNVARTAVYQNTVVASAAAPALRLGPHVYGLLIRNNIFVAMQGPVITAARALPPAAAQLQGNDYFSAGSWSIAWGPVAYGSLAAWRPASSQEMVAGRPAGFEVNPQLVGPILNLHQQLAGPSGAAGGFALNRDSQLLGAGLDLEGLGMRPGSTDYSGNSQPVRHPNVGAISAVASP